MNTDQSLTVRPALARAIAAGAILVALLATTGSASAQPTDPRAVFDAFHAAVNAHDVDAALAFFADDAVVEFPNQPPPNVFRGTQEIRAWLQGDADQNIAVQTENVQVAGEHITWTVRVDIADLRPLGITLVGSAEATVREGKFTTFSFTLSDETLAQLQAIPAQPQALPQTGDAAPWLWLLALAGLLVCAVGLELRRRTSG